MRKIMLAIFCLNSLVLAVAETQIDDLTDCLIVGAVLVLTLFVILKMIFVTKGLTMMEQADKNTAIEVGGVGSIIFTTLVLGEIACNTIHPWEVIAVVGVLFINLFMAAVGMAYLHSSVMMIGDAALRRGNNSCE